jgi:SAM-dependent methyltransferase
MSDLPPELSNASHPTVPAKKMSHDDLSLPFELKLLSGAHQYQRWVSDSVTPFLGNRILEIGAGIGNMSKWLPMRERLILSEGEPALAASLHAVVKEVFGDNERAQVSIVDVTQDWYSALVHENLDTVISFNVLEHVEDDKKVIGKLLELLRQSKAPGLKRLVSFVPAHQWAFGTIDQSYGHYRRYSKKSFLKMVQELAPDAQVYARHLNLVGLPSWFVMNRILKKKEIGMSAVAAFEKLCPWIRRFDDFIHCTLRVPLGQSLLVVLTLD